MKGIDVSSFATGNVTDMSYMFQDCIGFESLNLGSFDTSNVTDMSYMFYGCQALENIDLSTFDTSSVTTMENMLGYNGLKTILTPKKTGDVICKVPGTFLDDDSMSHQTLVANAEKSYRFQRVSD